MNERIIVLFPINLDTAYSNNMGYNLYQRRYFINNIEILPGQSIREMIKLWKIIYTPHSKICIVTERSINTLFGFIFHMLFRNVKWVVDIPDCPFKESLIFYKRGSLKWLLSLVKSYIAYFVFRFADEIIISFSSKYFFRHYRGNKDKVHCFKNALPSLPKVHKPLILPIKGTIKFIYVGSNLDALGLPFFITVVKAYNDHAQIPIELNIYGHSAKSDSAYIIYHGKRPREEILEALRNSHVGVSPMLRGTDVEFAYPIKSMEYFCYGNKLLLSATTGLLEQFENINSRDLYFAEPGNIDSFIAAIDRCISDIVSLKCDTIRHLAEFSAENKNRKISEIYNYSSIKDGDSL